MYLGGGAYGVEAASRLYFDKHAKDLDLEEAALIAGIFQLPERQSPSVNMKWALQRRNYVLRRMAEERYISQAEADAARARPIVVAQHAGAGTSLAPYFVEEVRKYVEHRFGANAYEAARGADLARRRSPAGGQRALERGLRQPTRRIPATGRNIRSEGCVERFQTIMEPAYRAEDVVPAVVTVIGGVRRPPGRARRIRALSAALLAAGATGRIGRLHVDLARTPSPDPPIIGCSFAASRRPRECGL
jgi:membrane carboxypeptidase/penicillin-binding protein